MKKSLFILILFVSSVMVAQVGINTVNPQQEVHVADDDANVRLEGLNKPNNVENLGAESTTRVFVNAEGDLVLGALNELPMEILVDTEDYLMGPDITGNASSGGNAINQTGAGSGFKQAGLPNDIPSSIFTLTEDAIVEVHYSVSWTIWKNNQGRIFESAARVVQTGLYFRSFNNGEDTSNPYNGIPVIDGIDEPINGYNSNGDSRYYCLNSNCSEKGGLVALNGQFYTNGDKDNGVWEDLRNNGTDYVKLPAGTYVALFVGQVAVSSAQGVGNIKAFLGTGKDELQIIAHYFN